MKNLLKKGLVIVSIYMVFTMFLFMASYRIDRLESSYEQDNNVTTKISE